MGTIDSYELKALKRIFDFGALHGYGVQVFRPNASRWRVSLFGQFWGQPVSLISDEDTLERAVNDVINRSKK